MSNLNKQQSKSGDTIIEVIFAITIFCLVAVLSVGMMNEGLRNSESALEITVVRNEINAQAETLRYIHSNYVAEKGREEIGKYSKIWEKIVNKAIDGDEVPEYPIASCVNDNFVNDDDTDEITNRNKFIINARTLDADKTVITTSSRFTAAPVFSRLVYTDSSSSSEEVTANSINDNQSATILARAEGIWDIVAAGPTKSNPEYYDFYIRSCWYTPGSTTPTTIGTVIRLSNPDFTGGTP